MTGVAIPKDEAKKNKVRKTGKNWEVAAVDKGTLAAARPWTTAVSQLQRPVSFDSFGDL